MISFLPELSVWLALSENQPAIGEQVLTVSKAWGVYDPWLNDPRLEFHPEPRGLDVGFLKRRRGLRSDATLVTFDKALFDLARNEGHAAVVPA